MNIFLSMFAWWERTEKQCLYTDFHATQDPRDNKKQVLIYEHKKKYEVKFIGLCRKHKAYICQYSSDWENIKKHQFLAMLYT